MTVEGVLMLFRSCFCAEETAVPRGSIKRYCRLLPIMDAKWGLDVSVKLEKYSISFLAEVGDKKIRKAL